MPLTSTGEPGGIESASYPTKYQYGHYLNKSRLIQEHTANQIHTYIHTHIQTTENAQKTPVIRWQVEQKNTQPLLKTHKRHQ